MEHRTFTDAEIRDVDEKTRSFTHAISDESEDGHGSIIKVDGWDLKRFRSNPIVLFAHDSLGLPIGRSRKIWIENKRLMSRTEFAGSEQSHGFAETAFKLVRDGFLKAWSVGFRSIRSIPRDDLTPTEKSRFADPRIHIHQELMEYSLVPVPSNPNALMNDARRRDFENLMEMADRNKSPDSFLGVLVRGIEKSIEKSIARHMLLREKIGTVPISRRDADRYFETRSPFGPAEMTVREYWNLPERDREPIRTPYDHFNDRMFEIERRGRHGGQR